MALPVLQYFKFKQLMRGTLSVEGVNPSDADVLRFFGQLFADSVGAGALSAARQFLAGEICRRILSGDGTNPNDADVRAFFTQVQTDASGMTMVGARYSTMKRAFLGALSCDAFSPTQADLLSYFGSFTLAVNPLAPLLMFDGQSNDGNQDSGTAGWTTDARVTFTWINPADGSVNGPGPLVASQANAGGTGHSFELSCSTDLAAAYNSQIYVGKSWADGQIATSFNRGGGGSGWGLMQKAIGAVRNSGPQQVAFTWCQGESEAQTVNSAQTANWQTNTAATWASIRAQFKAVGINRVRFFLVQTNLNISSDASVDAGQLASVRAQQAALVAADIDAVMINADDIAPAVNIHYATGQTLTIGHRLATQIFADMQTQTALVSVPTVETILAGTLVEHHHAADLSANVGGVMTTWADRSGNGNTRTGTGSPRPAVIAAALNGKPGVRFDGTQNLATTTLSLPLPGTTPTFIWRIMRQDGWVNLSCLEGKVAANPSLLQQVTAPAGIRSVMSVNTGVIQSPLGTFNCIQTYHSNSIADFLKIHNSNSTGTALGNLAIGNVTLGGGVNTFAASTLCERIVANALPSTAQLDALDAYTYTEWGLTVG